MALLLATILAPVSSQVKFICQMVAKKLKDSGVNSTLHNKTN